MFGLPIGDPSLYTAQTWAIYILFGTLGLLVRIAATDSLIVLPHREPKGLRLGIFGEWIVAVTASLIVDNNALSATLAAIGAATAVRAFLKIVPNIVQSAIARSVTIDTDKETKV